MSAHRPGHDPYMQYGAPANPEDHPEERVFVPNVQDIQHGGPHGQGLHDPYLGAHQQQQHQHQQQQQQQHQAYAEQPIMAHHPSSQYVPGPGMIYGGPMGPQSGGMGQPPGGMGHTSPSMSQPSGTKRPRPDDLDDMREMGMQQQQMRSDMPSMSHMPPQSMISGYPPLGPYHTHMLPPGHRAKMPRISDGDSSVGPSGGAQSMVGSEGMPAPAPRPRGPKLKFTPEDDALLVDLKENRALTWKQIAEFFPGRSSGTLQVRYCTKLKAKTTQWTDETIQKLQTALRDYENEKWRIVAGKIGPGFTAAACKEKASEL